MQKWYKWVREHFALHCTVCVHLEKKEKPWCMCALCVIWDVPLCIWSQLCACGLHYVLSATVSADGRPAWVTQHILCSSSASVMMNSFLPLVLCTQTHIAHLYHYLFNTHDMCTLWHFFFLISTRATKSNSNTYFLGDGDKSRVGGVS